MGPAPLLQLLIGVSLLRLGSQQAICSFPDGTPSLGDVPCNGTNSPIGSACCGPTAQCMDKGLCYGFGQLSRGSCSGNWTSENSPCAQYCKEYFPSGGAGLSACAPGKFQCGSIGDSSTCNGNISINENIGFLLSPGQTGGSQAVTVRPGTVLRLANQSSSSAASTSLATPTSSNASYGTNNTKNQGYSAGTLAGATIGVGAPLALALACACYILFKQRALIRSLERIRENSSLPSHDLRSEGIRQTYSTEPKLESSDRGNFAELDTEFAPRELQGH